jgi:hypothetical protein
MLLILSERFHVSCLFVTLVLEIIVGRFVYTTLPYHKLILDKMELLQSLIKFLLAITILTSKSFDYLGNDDFFGLVFFVALVFIIAYIANEMLNESWNIRINTKKFNNLT